MGTRSAVAEVRVARAPRAIRKDTGSALRRLARARRLTTNQRLRLRAVLSRPAADIQVDAALISSGLAGPDVEQGCARLLRLAARLPKLLAALEREAAAILRSA